MPFQDVLLFFQDILWEWGCTSNYKCGATKNLKNSKSNTKEYGALGNYFLKSKIDFRFQIGAASGAHRAAAAGGRAEGEAGCFASAR